MPDFFGYLVFPAELLAIAEKLVLDSLKFILGSGFSAHSSEAALHAMERFDFDTILFPVNYVCYYKADFGPEVIHKAREKKMGILGL